MENTKKVTEIAYAKVNLALGITGIREDGYHLVDMIMHKLELHDVVTVEEVDESMPPIAIEIVGNDALSAETAQKIDSNLCAKAYKAYMLAWDVKHENGEKVPHIKLNLDKNIPMAAGLAGGSSDAAATLKCLNKIYNLYEEDELMALAAGLGADIPFCLNKSKCMRCRGIGEILTPAKSISGVDVILAKIPEGMSTPECYRGFDKLNNENSGVITQPNIEECLEILSKHDIVGLNRCAHNVLEPVTTAKYNQLLDIEKQFLISGAGFVRMTGSGPTIFALYNDLDDKKYQDIASLNQDITFIKTRLL